MITNEDITASQDTKSEGKILFSNLGLEKEQTGYLCKYVEEMQVGRR